MGKYPNRYNLKYHNGVHFKCLNKMAVKGPKTKKILRTTFFHLIFNQSTLKNLNRTKNNRDYEIMCGKRQQKAICTTYFNESRLFLSDFHFLC